MPSSNVWRMIHVVPILTLSISSVMYMRTTVFATPVLIGLTPVHFLPAYFRKVWLLNLSHCITSSSACKHATATMLRRGEQGGASEYLKDRSNAIKSRFTPYKDFLSPITPFRRLLSLCLIEATTIQVRKLVGNLTSSPPRILVNCR